MVRGGADAVVLLGGLSDDASRTKGDTMSAAATAGTLARPRSPIGGNLSALATLASRRLRADCPHAARARRAAAHPVLFALVIAPALKKALHTSASYESFVAVGTLGLLIPLNTMFAGLSVIVDRESGAQRELLAAPINRSLLVFGNLVIALATTALQIGVLIAFALARGIHFHPTVSGVLWFAAAAVLFAIGMYGVAETLAAGCRERRSTSPACRRSRSCRGSSPARSSRSRRCRSA